MQDSQEPQPLGSKINYGTKDNPNIKYPYQEQKEQQQQGKEKFEKLIVFGQGPVKPVLLYEELTPDQNKEWEEFKKDPLHNKEPDFRVIEGDAYLSSFVDIDKRPDLNTEEKTKLKELKRQEWQNMGRFALNRWGRENAIAAGLALFLGNTNKVIFSGGQTIPDWAKKSLPTERLQNWPSEAKLMKDIIVRRFGNLYFQKYGKSIEQALEIEDGSTNTLLNFANSIVKDPSLISKNARNSLLATDFHMARCQILADLFMVANDTDSNIKAQTILKKRAEIRNKFRYQEIQKWLTDIDNNPDLKLDQIPGEKRWTRGLVDPEFTAYFATYFGQFNTPETIPVLQHAINLFRSPERLQLTKELFEAVGLSFAEFSEADLLGLSKNNPDKFNQLIEGLKKIPRVFPPEEK